MLNNNNIIRQYEIVQYSCLPDRLYYRPQINYTYNHYNLFLLSANKK